MARRVIWIDLVKLLWFYTAEYRSLLLLSFGRSDENLAEKVKELLAEPGDLPLYHRNLHTDLLGSVREVHSHESMTHRPSKHAKVRISLVEVNARAPI